MLVLFVIPLGAEVSFKPLNVILIGWDGVQRQRLREMLSRGELPNLQRLSKEGTLVNIDVTSGATDTKAGWTQILTGYMPEKTGVYSNSRYQPVPEGYSVFERLEAFFEPDNIVTAAIIGKKGNVGADPPKKVPYQRWARRHQKGGRVVLEGGQIVEENGRKFVAIPGKPWYNAKQAMDLFVNGLGQCDNVGNRTLEELEKYKDRRFFFFVHFGDPDSAGHRYGENSKEYEEAIKACDEWLGKIVAKLKELGLYDHTLIYVTADHGFDEGETSHRYAPYIFLATNDKKVNRDGDRSDIAPTILKRFGINLKKIQPPLDGVSLDEPAPKREVPPPPATKPKRVKSSLLPTVLANPIESQGMAGYPKAVSIREG